ncbi:MAG: uncharacterized protein PWQ55_2379 [Chloroflexota bacterium]|nr:uncharacterized protein [Chloroflexota bacterium]
MQLINELLESVKNDAPVRNVLIGAHWTMVSSRGCGMASTVTNPLPHGEGKVRDAGKLHLKSARELAAYLQSDIWLEASIGLAALNSLLEVPQDKVTAINAFKVVAEKSPGNHVAIFGHFPYLDEIRGKARRLSVFELNPVEGELNLDKVPEVLPDADVVAITSNSVINHTLEDILPHLNPKAFSVLVGPSTPLSPVLFEAGFDLLAGVRILDEAALMQTVSQAAQFRQTEGAELITIAK